MTDDLKEQLRQPLGMSMFLRADDMHAEMEAQRKEALAHITDLEARLAAAEAGEDALAELCKEVVRLFEALAQRPKPDAQYFRPTMDSHGLVAMRSAIAAYEARRKG